ncbi:polyribonucleotide nucleotidyltransferase [candidate division KSB3 bacterium]|uniref:Polyribonucleotide nucleotidyltransferase n=1 Tax=candidate division KSB3 bacterium TaxID=2044937 RepID=A0A2G6E9N9_9BACT|nr:MAG: polyribonucleotide nucleotidyltransferase [candidate division KSB3 bacterium]PIE30846.1 MAG: polyribonucleotide nucleotidyltransferase [candidate division KSB3 bacterium]
MQKAETVQVNLGGKVLTVETGRLAKQANGAVVMRCGDTVVLVTAVASKDVRQGIDFFPLMVEYREKAYAAGKIPGGFFKREGKPGDHEVLVARLIDRPIRPLFPDGYKNEVQIIATVLSVDGVNPPDVLGMIGASAALAVSDIPFLEPIGSLRVGRIHDEFVINPSSEELEKSDLNIVLSGTYDAVVMIEGEAEELPEHVLADAVAFGHTEIKKIIEMQRELQQRLAVTKQDVRVEDSGDSLSDRVTRFSKERVDRLYDEALKLGKEAYQEKIDALFDETLEEFIEADDEELAEKSKAIAGIIHDVEKEVMRANILDKGKRVDGRALNEIRPISCHVGELPRTHGSAVFTRGETQALVVTTLGTAADEQRLDTLEGESTKSFMLHYNFPPFSVGEVKMLRGAGRREIGHGALAERALAQVLPPAEEFPYTIRLVSDILESNGSSSMATVCGGTLALMDAGVPIKSPVAGIAMGLISGENGKAVILSDIAGLEDHLGDMDLKVAGTRDGVTAIQMDLKICGISHETFTKALAQAREGRMFILGKIEEAIVTPRDELSPYAPRIFTMKIDPDKIRTVIGPGGKVIRGIVEESGAKIDIEDDGTISIASTDQDAADKATAMIERLVEEVEEGKIYLGKVRTIVDFGAFIEVLPGTDGLVHISELAEHRVKKVTDEVAEGDEILVKVIGIDKRGKIKLSRKAVLLEEKAAKSRE